MLRGALLGALCTGLVASPMSACDAERDVAAEEPPGRRLDGTIRLDGRHGHYVLELRAEPPTPRVGQIFRVITLVRQSDTGRAVEGARVVVDAEMPQHGHGMTTRPEHREIGGGHYVTEGMKLHMPGRWVLTVGVEAEREDEARIAIEQAPAHLSPEGARR